MKESLRLYFNWVTLAAFVLQDSCWENGIFPIFIDQGGREESPCCPVTGQSGIPLQPGWKYQQQQDVVFVRGLFPVPGPYKHTGAHQMCLSAFLFWMALTLPPSVSTTQSFFFLPLFLFPSCRPWPCPMRRSPPAWPASSVWPFQARRTNRNGRVNRRRRGGGITGALERWEEVVMAVFSYYSATTATLLAVTA